MFCPKCGKRQASEDVRFCTKCGLPLESAAKSLTAGSDSLATGTRFSKGQLSPRAKGILQGIAIIPGLFGAWLGLDMFFEAVFKAGMLGGLYAMITLILLTGLLRVLYAVFLEEGSRKAGSKRPAAEDHEIDTLVNIAALPVSEDIYARGLSPQSMDTGDMIQPRSVTENTTTRLKMNR